MTGNSTLLFILDGSEGESELVNVDDMLDPTGKCSKELQYTFGNLDLSPGNEVIQKILMSV